MRRSITYGYMVLLCIDQGLLTTLDIKKTLCYLCTDVTLRQGTMYIVSAHRSPAHQAELESSSPTC